MWKDCDIFNAGKGSVKTENGEFELDASIMDGTTLNSGAVGCVKYIKNPIIAASKVKYLGAITTLGFKELQI